MLLCPQPVLRAGAELHREAAPRGKHHHRQAGTQFAALLGFSRQHSSDDGNRDSSSHTPKEFCHSLTWALSPPIRALGSFSIEWFFTDAVRKTPSDSGVSSVACLECKSWGAVEAALPPSGTARSALFLPGQLELDPKQSQIIAALTRTPWGLSQPQGLRTSWVSPAALGGRSGQAEEMECTDRECRSWVQLELHQHLPQCWVQTLHSLCCAFWQVKCHDPGSPCSSPLLIPPLTVLQQRFYYCISPFSSSGSSLLSFPPRCGGCFKVFFLSDRFWQLEGNSQWVWGGFHGAWHSRRQLVPPHWRGSQVCLWDEDYVALSSQKPRKCPSPVFLTGTCSEGRASPQSRQWENFLSVGCAAFIPDVLLLPTIPLRLRKTFTPIFFSVQR